MEKYFGEKQQRFSFRKLSVGLVSATISSLFFMSVLGSSSVNAQETKGCLLYTSLQNHRGVDFEEHEKEEYLDLVQKLEEFDSSLATHYRQLID